MIKVVIEDGGILTNNREKRVFFSHLRHEFLGGLLTKIYRDLHMQAADEYYPIIEIEASVGWDFHGVFFSFQKPGV